MMKTNSRACIYCNERYDFTDEHVFPAGLGGDDNYYLLVDMVCGSCNNAFSKFENTLMRSSPVALARLFMQEHGRGKGSKARSAKIAPRITTMFDEECGQIEAEVSTGAQLVALTQLIFGEDGKINLAGQSGKQELFRSTLQQLLSDQVFTVQKQKESSPAKYHISNLIWSDGIYVMNTERIADKPPENCVWLEPLDYGQNNTSQNPRLFQRTSGQIVLRLRATPTASELLSTARIAVEKFENHVFGPDKTIENPLVMLSMSMNIDHVHRVLAKIGVNLIAKVFGEEYARHFAFNSVKKAILTGKPTIHINSSPAPYKPFEGVPSEKHVLTLTFRKSRAGRYCVALVIRLYGASTYCVHLSSNAISPFPYRLTPFLHPNFIFVVDYKNHKIERYSSHEFLAKYPVKIQLSPLEHQEFVANMLAQYEQQSEKMKKVAKRLAY